MEFLYTFISGIFLFTFIFCIFAVIRELFGVAKCVYLKRNYDSSIRKTAFVGAALSYIITYLILI